MMAVVASQPTEFTLRLRVPGWLAGPMQVLVNGQAADGRPDAKHWLPIRRTWRAGDTVRVTLPLRLTSCPIAAATAESNAVTPVAAELNSAVRHPAAIVRGPVVLAVRSPEGPPHRKIDLAHLDDELVPSPGEALTYHVKSDASLLVRPFYAYRQGEQYFMYLDPPAGA
jgi:DUF1680 family protein